MKKPLLICCLALLACRCFAQEVKTIYNEVPPFYLERFEVLKSDKKIKQGAYQLTTKYNSAIVTTGFYKNNKKDSVWCEYDLKKNKVAEGSYKDGAKVGEWINYDDKGSIISRYDYSKTELVFYKRPKSDSTAIYKVIMGADIVSTKLDRVPVIVTGNNTMWRDIALSIKYPAKARENNISGKVIITFKIDETGKTSDYKIIKKIGYGCDEEALNAVQYACNKDWVPGVFKDNKVSIIYTLPVSFTLSSN